MEQHQSMHANGNRVNSFFFFLSITQISPFILSNSLNAVTGVKTNLSPMTAARSSYAATRFGGKIYVAGGKSGDGSILASVECYDANENSWTEVSKMNHPRENFALVAANGFLYAIGCEKTIERYDPMADIWTVV